MRVIEGDITSAIDAFVTRRPADGGTWITTQCLYPGGDSVPVFVAGGPRTFAVSDEGAGWDALLTAGVDVTRTSHGPRARNVADLMGVDYRDDAFCVDDLNHHQLAAAIVLVANASQRWVTEILSDRYRRQERHLQRRVAEQLRRLFPSKSVRSAERLLGASTKSYEFANVVTLANRLLIVEPVTNHANAIASAHLKLTDVHRAHPTYPREIVIEEQPGWDAGDLSVLSDASDGIRDIADGLAGLPEKYAA